MKRVGRATAAAAAALLVLLFLLVPALAADQGGLSVDQGGLAAALQGTALPGPGGGGGGGGGACGIPPAAPWAAGVAALSPNSTLALQTSPLSGCGICLHVSSGAASAVVQVVDTCLSCAGSELALDPASFARLGQPTDASGSLQLPVTYALTECTPPGNATVSVDIYRAGDGGYLRLAIFNLVGSSGIQELELRQAPLVGGRLDIVASSWRRMLNTHGAHWELSGIPTPPLDLRVTDGAGRQLLLRKVIVEEGKTGIFGSTAQFPLSNSAAGIAASAAADLAQPAPGAALLVPLEDTEPAAAEDDMAAGSVGFGAAADEDGAAAAALLPAPTPQAPPAAANASCQDTVLAVLTQHPSLTALVALIRTAGVEAAFQSDIAGLTVLAPTNAALALAVQLVPLIRFQAAALRAVLLQHLIVAPIEFSTQFSTYDTLGGGQLRIRRAQTTAGSSRLLIVSDASAATAPLQSTQACGSSVRLVDTVLLPAQLARRRRR